MNKMFSGIEVLSCLPLERVICGFDINDREVLDFLLINPPAGVILFARNFVNWKENRDFVLSLRRESPTLIVSIDHEGGRVQRFKAPFTILPPYRELTTRKTSKELFEIFMLLSKELLSAGINMNLAPVGDMTDNVDGVIGDRSIGTDLEKVESAISATE